MSNYVMPSFHFQVNYSAINNSWVDERSWVILSAWGSKRSPVRIPSECFRLKEVHLTQSKVQEVVIERTSYAALQATELNHIIALVCMYTFDAYYITRWVSSQLASWSDLTALLHHLKHNVILIYYNYIIIIIAMSVMNHSLSRLV